MASRGDVVLVPFPFTDLSATQIRPAVVVCTDVYAASTRDVIVAMVTSRPQTLPTDYALQDWAATGLLYPSWVRAKVVSLEGSLIRHVIGPLSARDLSEVETRLRLALGF